MQPRIRYYDPADSRVIDVLSQQKAERLEREGEVRLVRKNGIIQKAIRLPRERTNFRCHTSVTTERVRNDWGALISRDPHIREHKRLLHGA
jgi:hypothetical protein